MYIEFISSLPGEKKKILQNSDFVFLETLLEEAVVSSVEHYLGVKRPQYRLISIQISISHLQGLCSDWWKRQIGLLLALNLASKSMRFLRPGERARM